MVSIKLLYVDHIYILPQKDSNEFLEKLRKDFLLGEDKSKWIEDITKNVEIEAYKDKEIIPVDKKLNIAKVGGVYRMIQTSTPILPHVMSIKVSKFGFVVIQTLPGNANALAYFLDQTYAHAPQSDSGILGTIAGDDTVLVLIRGPEEMEGTLSLLKNHFPRVTLS